MMMNSMVWNARGAGSKEFVQDFKSLVKIHKPNLVGLVETRVGRDRANKIVRRLGFSNWRIFDGRGFSGGIWILWNNDVRVNFIDDMAQAVSFDVGYDNKNWKMTVVYGSPNPTNRERLWDYLRACSSQFQGAWVVGGDFNEIACSSEKSNFKNSDCHRCRKLQTVLADCSLLDLGFSGAKYTWYKSPTAFQSIKERLDKYYCNADWRLEFSDAVVCHLPRINSDHCPILLRVFGYPPPASDFKPFRFEGAWMQHEDFEDMVQKSWERSEASISDRLLSLQAALKKWNSDVFGNIFRRKRTLLNRIKGVQRERCFRDCRHLADLEDKLQKELREVSNQEATLWYQKSRTNWILSGDLNTSYYHSVAVVKRNRRKVRALKTDEGDWITDQAELKQLAVDHFAALFTAPADPIIRPSVGVTFPQLDRMVLDEFHRPVTDVEIKNALFSIGAYKAPGPDGFQAIFFQQQWDLVGSEVIEVVKEAFCSGSVPENLNKTFLTLIPKVDCPEKITQFRPISLCNVVYKVIPKIIVSRLKPLLPSLISPNQSSFVPGRQIADNIAIVQEMIHSFKNKKGHVGNVVWKIDLEKAYDKMNWEFLRETLSEIGFDSSFINLIMSCVNSASFQVLWNGEVTEEFKSSRGLRQGDPLSPYLFVIGMEKLAHIIQSRVADNRWKAVKASRQGPPISHLFFADDLVLFSSSTNAQIQLVRQCLEEFARWSGQTINLSKSKIFVSKNISGRRAREISRMAEIPITTDLGRYLGVPLIHGRVTKKTYWPLVERFQAKLANWKINQLSLAGRCILVKSAAAPIALHTMQSAKLPSGVCDKLDSLSRQFVWGSTSDKRRIHLVSWENVCVPKGVGGLGFRSMKNWNSISLAKLAWRFLTEPGSLWVQLIKAKYFTQGRGENDDSRVTDSHIWRSLLHGRDVLQPGLVWRIGDGNSVNFWSDKWLFDYPLIEAAQAVVPEAELGKMVRDYWGVDGWDIDLLSTLLPADVVNAIRPMICASSTEISDEIIWKCASDGNFSMKSAYHELVVPDSDSPIVVKQIWKLKVFPRIRYFMWLVWHDRLLTNHQRAERHLAHDDSCHCCPGVVESSLHVIRDCSNARAVWDDFVPETLKGAFFSLPLLEWLHLNLYVNQNLTLKNVCWPSLFALICWKLWTWRNEVCFTQVLKPIAAKLQGIHMQIQELIMLGAASKSSPKVVVQHHWDKPIDGWWKVNSDGSWCQEKNIAGAGGVIRDSLGNWVVGFGKCCGDCSIDKAELWGILHGLRLAWNRGIRFVELETDSESSVRMIQNNVGSKHPLFVFIQEIRQLISRDWECHVKYIPRQKNQVADWLAKNSLTQDHDLVIWDEPPQGLSSLLLADSMCISFPRLVRN